MLGLLSLTIILYHLTWGRIRVKRRKRHSFREPPSENKSRVRQRVREEHELHHESGKNNLSEAGVDESQRNGDGVEVLPAQVEVQPCPSPSSSSTTDRGCTASPSPTLVSMEKKDPPLTSKDDTVHQDSKKNSNDDSKVCSAQGVLQTCPATSVTNDCCGAASTVLVNDCKTKTDSTLVPKVDLVQKDSKNPDNDSKVPSAPVNVQPCPAISSSVRTDCRGAASPDSANVCTAKTKSTLVDLVRQDTKKNSDDDTKVPSAQVDVQPCPAISSSVRTDCRGAASLVLVNDDTAKTNSTLFSKVDLVRQDSKNSDNDSKVPSAQVSVQPCPAISSSVRTDCRGAASLVLVNVCTAKTKSTLVDLVRQDTKGNADADTSVVSTNPDEQPCPAPSSLSINDYPCNALPVMATDSTAKINSTLASGINKRNGNNDIQLRSTKPGVQPCRAAMSLTGDCGGTVLPVLATDLTARKDCSWATIVDMIRRDPKGFADNILSAIVDVKPRPATCLSLTKDCSDPASHVPATDDFPAKTNCTLASKADMVHQVAKGKGNGKIQVRSVNPDAQPGQAAITSSPVLAIDDAARKDDCAWTTIIDVFCRDPKGFADKVRSAFVDIKPRPATCWALTKNCSGPVSPVQDTAFPTNTNSTLVSEGDKAHQVGQGFADKALPAKTDVKPRPANCLLLTKDQCNGPASCDAVSDFPTKTKCTLDSKGDMVHEVGKGNDDNPLSANVDVQFRLAASVSFTIACGGAKSHVPVTDRMAKSDCNLASKGDTVSKDTEVEQLCPATSISSMTPDGAASSVLAGDCMANPDSILVSKVDTVRHDAKGHCDDIQTCETTSSLSTINCEGAVAFVPATDLMAETDSTLTSKQNRNHEQVSSPSFHEMMDFLGLSFNADDATAGSIDTLKNDGFYLQSEPNDTKALVEAAAKIKMPPQKPKRRRSIRTGNSVTIVTGTPTPRNDGNTVRLLKSSTDSAPAPLSHSPLKESPLGHSLKDIDGRAYGDNTSTSVSIATKDTLNDDKACSTMMSKEAPFSSIRDDEQQMSTQPNINGNRKRRISLSSIKKRILSTFSRSRKEDEVPLLSEEYD